MGGCGLRTGGFAYGAGGCGCGCGCGCGAPGVGTCCGNDGREGADATPVLELDCTGTAGLMGVGADFDAPALCAPPVGCTFNFMGIVMCGDSGWECVCRRDCREETRWDVITWMPGICR